MFSKDNAFFISTCNVIDYRLVIEWKQGYAELLIITIRLDRAYKIKMQKYSQTGLNISMAYYLLRERGKQLRQSLYEEINDG